MSKYKMRDSFMDRKGTNILEGEASESDDECSEIASNVKSIESKVESKLIEGPSSGVVVSGEASESDDEFDDYVIQDQTSHEFEISNGVTVLLEARKPKFESLFHKKLWERNFSFRHGIVEHHLERYNSLINKLKTFIPPSNRSQNFAQEALKDYRVISILTKQLNDNLENVLSQVNLPDYKTIMTRAGGTSSVKEATAEVQQVIEKIKDQVLNKVNHTLDKYEAVSYKTQVVSGLNYFIKVRTGDDSFIHLRIYRPLPFENEKLELHGVQEHKTKEEDLEYF